MLNAVKKLPMTKHKYSIQVLRVQLEKAKEEDGKPDFGAESLIKRKAEAKRMIKDFKEAIKKLKS